jgi:hypothetical protein
MRQYERMPWMMEDQIELVKKILLSFGKNHLNILEWGAGGSTLYFTRFLERHGISYNWYSVEHRVKWYDIIQKEITSPNIKLILKKQKADNPSTINLDHYVHYPRELTGKLGVREYFDFILVDGRARARCLVEAKFLVKPGGIILLHDAEREKYHYVFQRFESWKMIESKDKPHAIWMAGDIEKVMNPFLPKEEIYNKLLSLKETKIPFCLLRFGDGEGLFAFPEWNMPELYAKVCLKHWGEVPDQSEKQIIAGNIQKAFIRCDMAGLPPRVKSFMDFESDLWIKTHRSFTSLHEHPSLMRMDIHMEMLQDNFLDKMIAGQDLFYISCRNVDELLIQKGAKSVQHLLISPQCKYEKNLPKEKLYRQIPAIEQQLKQTNLSKRICLLGAGVAGKHLGIILRDQGGMVLDIGSIFDYWAGVKSRTWIKNNSKNIQL